MITRSLELLREMLRKDPAPSVRQFGDDAVRMALEEEAQLRADLATVTAERAKDRERDTATMQTLLDIESENSAALAKELHAERAAHKKTLVELNKTQNEREAAAQYGETERSSHAETRKALELYRSKWEQRGNDLEFVNGALESTRAELAKAEARVKAAIEKLMNIGDPGDFAIADVVAVLRG